MKIYVVEDEENIRELVIYSLNASGYEAEGFEDGEVFRTAMQTAEPDLIILDIMLPGEDGISILKWLKSTFGTRELPVIMLTAKSAEYDKVLGLDAGADDYVTKPFGVMELVSRVRAVLRRSIREKGGGDALVRGPIFVDTARYSVAVNDKEIPLTVKEFELLRLLLENIGHVFNREQLLERIWGYSFDGETRTVDVHIRSLRKKLEEGGDLIETVRGVGYRIG